MDEFATWKPIPPEELEEMREGEPVVILTTEWKKEKKRANSYLKANFRSYSPGRGLVTVDLSDFSFSDRSIANLWDVETLVCDRNVGRCGMPEHGELHTDNGAYDE